MILTIYFEVFEIGNKIKFLNIIVFSYINTEILKKIIFYFKGYFHLLDVIADKKIIRIKYSFKIYFT